MIGRASHPAARLATDTTGPACEHGRTWSKPGATLGLLWWLSACAGSPLVESKQHPLDQLQVGSWVQARGRFEAAGPTVTDVETVRRTDSDKADKFEVTSHAETPTVPSAVQLLGIPFAIIDKTTWESLDRQEVEAYAVTAGDWLQVKARSKEDGQVNARTIRRVNPQGHFEVLGELLALDRDQGTLRIGGVDLRLPPDPATLDVSETLQARDPLQEFLADERRAVPFTLRLTDDLRLGGGLSVEADLQDEYDLNKRRARDRNQTSATAKLDLLWRFDTNGSFALLEGEAGLDDTYNSSRPDTHDTGAQISRAFAYWRIGQTIRLQAGRQDFYEPREWLYDELLDGVRARVQIGNVELEGAAAAGRELLADDNSTEDTLLFTGLAKYHLTDDWTGTAYAIQRKDSTDTNFEPFLYGLRSYARPSRGFGHWLELAHSTGYLGRTQIDGLAIDVGVMYRTSWVLRPSAYAGYAFATGKRDGSDEIGFRQTGLQDNNSKFGGVTSFRYYGEVFDPELANLEVTTLGVGIRPVTNAAVDVVFHTYRQHRAAATLVDTGLRASPEGLSRKLGWELDVITGWRPSSWLTLEAVYGWFDPGAAFAESDPAQKIGLQGRLKF